MKRLILFFLLIVGTLGLTARTLSPEEALERLDEGKSFIKGGGSPRASSKLVYTGEVNSTPQFYVFNRQGSGFVILSAESESRPIIGYSDSPADPDNMPPAAKAWLDGIQEGIAAGAFNRAKPSTKYRQPRPPLLSTKWGQDSPFNGLCPEVSGQHCVTGCGATSLAQILNYHKHPSSAHGSSYYYVYPNFSKSINIDMSQFQFEWDKMDDVYNIDSSPSHKHAVANLMFASGCALHMNYGPTESGTNKWAAAILRKYFDYSDYGVHASCYDFTKEEWENLLYEELSHFRPIIYTTGGHIFNIDGYEDGFFHVNWGWTGMWDGYFDIYYLTPSPNKNLYGGHSEADFNIFPSSSAQTPTPISSFYLASDFGVSDPEATQTSMIKFTGDIYNQCVRDIEASLGVKATNKETGESIYFKGDPTLFRSGNGRASYKLQMPGLADGEYIITPVYFYTDFEDPHEIPLSPFRRTMLTLKVNPYSYTFTVDPESNDLVCSNIEILSPICTINGLRFNVTIKSSSNRIISISPVLLKEGSDDEVFWGYDMTYTLPALTETVSEYYQPLSSTIPPGKYELRLRDTDSWVFVSDPVPVEVVADVPTTLDLLELTCETGETAPMDDISIKGKLKCSDGAYAQEPLFYLCKKEGNMLVPVAFFKSSLCVINAGESAEFTASCQYLAADPEQQYYVYWVWDDHMQQKSPHLTLSLYKPEHPEEPEDPDDPEEEDPHDDNPDQVDPDNPDEEDPNSVAPDPGEPIENQPGDANGDGYVNVTDVVLIIDYVLDNKPANFNKELADVNGDGYVNVTDVVMTIDIILKK